MTRDDAGEQINQQLNIEDIQPTEDQQRTMLAMARQAIAVALSREPADEVDTGDPFLAYCAGAFVTLRQKYDQRGSGPGSLRGCIGHMQADRPLWQVVPDMAVQAAMADPRFQPMSLPELEQVRIEIAILSPIRPVVCRDEIEIGRHGLVLIADWRRALLLPKSPTIYGWDLDQYLANLHRKAGLPPDYWPDRGELFAFTSFDFGE